jgi:hypothetical protein
MTSTLESTQETEMGLIPPQGRADDHGREFTQCMGVSVEVGYGAKAGGSYGQAKRTVNRLASRARTIYRRKTETNSTHYIIEYIKMQ